MIPEHDRISGLFLVGGEYVADIKTNDGRRLRRNFGTDRVRALRLFDALVEELEAEEGDNPRVADFLVERFLPTQRRLRSFTFSEKCIRSVVRFLEVTEPGLRLRETRGYHVERLRSYYAEHDYAARSINASVQKWSQALNLAVDLGLLEANPIARVKPLTVDNRRTRRLSMDDFVRILHAARETDARDLFVVLGLTGLRPSNGRLLTVGDVDFGDRMVRIPAEKMKNRRQGIVPVSRYVAERIVEVGGKGDALVFPAQRRGEETPKSDTNLSRSYRSIVQRLTGVEWSTLYDLRHFYASHLAKQGANEQQIGRLLCHVGQSVTSRYVHQDIEDLRHFVDELSERYLASCGVPSLSEHAEPKDEERITV